ncbi:hypothetical protein LLH00_12350 [bacterium]|nr:hypothetical protein [bacterium]
MNKTEYLRKSLLNAAGTVLYILGVAWLMFNGKHFIGDKPDNFLMPVFMLLLLVTSATVCGALVLGKPVQLFLEGQRKEAFILLLSTLAWLVLSTLCVLLILIM